LAVALLLEKGFRREDFARIHPGGLLGKRLLTRVTDVMVVEDLPVLGPAATMLEAVVQMAERRGTVMVVDDGSHLLGVVTVGDMMRLQEHNRDWQRVPVADVMTRTPRTTRADELGSAAVFRMQSKGIMALPVVGADGRVEGIVHLHDLLRAGSA
jgi:arabinose-5-phosphate isomerase